MDSMPLPPLAGGGADEDNPPATELRFVRPFRGDLLSGSDPDEFLSGEPA